jgi:hypothetical protein
MVLDLLGSVELAKVSKVVFTHEKVRALLHEPEVERWGRWSGLEMKGVFVMSIFAGEAGVEFCVDGRPSEDADRGWEDTVE